MTTCPNGHKNPDKQRFCGECGARIQIGRDPGVGDAAFRLVTVDIELPGKSGVLRRTKTVPVDDEAPPVDGRKMGAPSSKSGVPRSSAPAKSSASRLKALLIGGAAVLVLMVGCTMAVIRHNDKDRQNDS